MAPPPVQPSDETAALATALGRPKAEDAAKLCLNTWPPHTAMLHMRVVSSCVRNICYAVIDNQCIRCTSMSSSWKSTQLRPSLCTSWALKDWLEFDVAPVLNVGLQMQFSLRHFSDKGEC